MMGVPPDQARRLSLWEFLAIRTKWNARHRTPGDAADKVEAPSVETVRMSQADLIERGIAGNA